MSSETWLACARCMTSQIERATVVADDAADAPISWPQPAGARRLEHLDVGVTDEIGRQLANDAPARRAAAGVHYPAPRVAAFEPQREIAGAIRVEAHAQAL